MIHEEWTGMAIRALRLSEKQLLASKLALCGLFALQTPGLKIEFGRRRKVEHVLHLGHMTDLDTIEDVHSLLYRVDFVAIKIRCPLLELCKVFNGSQASLRSMNLLIMHATE